MAPGIKTKVAFPSFRLKPKDGIQKIVYSFNDVHRVKHHVEIKFKTTGSWKFQPPGAKTPTTYGPGEFVLNFTTNSHTLESMTILIIDPDPGRKYP